MIKINLLPREEQKRHAPISITVLLGILGGIVLLGLMGFGWYWLSQDLSSIRAQIADTQIQLKRYEQEAKLVDKIREDKKRLEDKIKVIESLVAAQSGPVRLLDEVSRALPNEVWLTSLFQTGKRLEIGGIANSNFSVASFMTSLGKSSSLLSNVDLVISEKAQVEQVPVERFSITAEVKEGRS